MNYTCKDYREGRRLLALRMQLDDEDLKPDERKRIEDELAELEKELGMD